MEPDMKNTARKKSKGCELDNQAVAIVISLICGIVSE